MERSYCCRGCGRGCRGGGTGGGSGGGACCLFVGFVDSNFRLSHGVNDAGWLRLGAGDVGEGDGLLSRL